MLGSIRQELLSGIKTASSFETLKSSLRAFEDLALHVQDYEKAAEAFSTCRAHGVQGSNIDFLICAVSMNYQLPVFSVDKDFQRYRLWLPVQLYSPPPES
jgi:predicted nucleic acid-binding protein